MPGETVRAFRDWFWRPPRPHGATVHDRVVSSLELFYDLVYVAVISQAAHHLAESVSPRTIAEFAVVFAMIWFAWINGSLYLEIHGRHDGRTRTFVFVQMGILALLAVYTASATSEEGGAFAIVYAVLLAVMGWLWYSVRGQDEARYRRVTAAYVTGMFGSVVVVAGTALLPVDARLLVWAGYVAAWLVAFLVFGRFREFEISVAPTHSMVERFGLFTIIVLGEVVIGVVDGLAHAPQDAVTIATGLLGLFVGFGFWWTYFDIVGRRLPRTDGPLVVAWLLSHLPITMAIAGAGAAMASLIPQAHDQAVPVATGWMLSGAVAVALLGLVAVIRTLDDAARSPGVYGKIAATMVVGAVLALAAAVPQPVPWVLTVVLAAILFVVWLVAIGRFLRAHAWSESESERGLEEPRPVAG